VEEVNEPFKQPYGIPKNLCKTEQLKRRKKSSKKKPPFKTDNMVPPGSDDKEEIKADGGPTPEKSPVKKATVSKVIQSVNVSRPRIILIKRRSPEREIKITQSPSEAKKKVTWMMASSS